MRIMALDVGTLRIGVALTDPLGYTAQPLLTIWRRSRGEDLRNVVRLIRKHEATHVVVGNPLHLSGEESAWGAKVREFAAELHRRAEVPVELFDERLTTVAAHEILNEAGVPRQDRAAIVDQVAAVVILRDWMAAQALKRSKEAGLAGL
jgi:putative Holliday junction resolvase